LPAAARKMRLPITGSLATLAAVDAVQVWRAGLRYYRTDKWCVGTLRSFPNEIHHPPALLGVRARRFNL